SDRTSRTSEYASAGTRVPFASRVSHDSDVEARPFAATVTGVTGRSRTSTSERTLASPIPLANTRAVTGPATEPRVALIVIGIVAVRPRGDDVASVISTAPFGSWVEMTKPVGDGARDGGAGAAAVQAVNDTHTAAVSARA